MRKLPVHHLADFVRVALSGLREGYPARSERRQRIAQFVRQGRQELVFAPVRFLSARRQCLQFVALGGDLLALTV